MVEIQDIKDIINKEVDKEKKKNLQIVKCRKIMSGQWRERIIQSEFDYKEFMKKDIVRGIAEEMLKNNFIDFEENVTQNGDVMLTGKIFIYKKSEK